MVTQRSAHATVEEEEESVFFLQGHINRLSFVALLLFHQQRWFTWDEWTPACKAVGVAENTATGLWHFLRIASIQPTPSSWKLKQSSQHLFLREEAFIALQEIMSFILLAAESSRDRQKSSIWKRTENQEKWRCCSRCFAGRSELREPNRATEWLTFVSIGRTLSSSRTGAWTVYLTQEEIRATEKMAPASKAQGRDSVSCEVLIMRVQEKCEPFSTMCPIITWLPQTCRPIEDAIYCCGLKDRLCTDDERPTSVKCLYCLKRWQSSFTYMATLYLNKVLPFSHTWVKLQVLDQVSNWESVERIKVQRYSKISFRIAIAAVFILNI